MDARVLNMKPRSERALLPKMTITAITIHVLSVPRARKVLGCGFELIPNLIPWAPRLQKIQFSPAAVNRASRRRHCGYEYDREEAIWPYSMGAGEDLWAIIEGGAGAARFRLSLHPAIIYWMRRGGPETCLSGRRLFRRTSRRAVHLRWCFRNERLGLA
jgi:hypothetical protein